MGEIIKNPDGTTTIKGGFSSTNPKDLELISKVIKEKVIKPEEKDDKK